MHPLQQVTHTARFHRRGESTETKRGEPVEAPYEQYAQAGVRVTAGGGGFAAVVGGSRSEQTPILSGPPRLVGEVSDAGDDRVTLEGDGYSYDENNPENSSWFRVTNTMPSFGMGRSTTGIEIELSQVSPPEFIA